ncbi:MAG: hypothetical protein ACP5RH_14785 [Leptodesmis sp.]
MPQDFQSLSGSKFKRLCGVSQATFAEMVAVLHPYIARIAQKAFN